MWDPQTLFSTETAAVFLGVSPQTLDAWRRRGIGPGYIRYPCAVVRNRNYVYRDWPNKRHGVIVYPLRELTAFVERYKVLAGRLPRPFVGRLPGGKNRPQEQRRDCARPLKSGLNQWGPVR